MPTAAENYEGRPVIIYSPTATGKTCSAEALADYFGKTLIVDEWTCKDLILDNALHLTSDPQASKIVSFARKTGFPAYVFHLADLAEVPGVNYLPPFEPVQTSALPVTHDGAA